MKKNSLKILLLGAVGGFSCILFHSGSYGGTPIALYQHPLHILIFYLLFFVFQSGLYYDHCFYDIRFPTVFASKLRRMLHLSLGAVFYLAVYFLCACILAWGLGAEAVRLCLEPNRVLLYLSTSALNLTILNLLAVNLSFLVKKGGEIFVEALLVVGGLGLCYGAPVIVPYVTVWYYGVYPTLVIHPLLFAVVYLAYFGLAVLVGYLPKKDLLRRP